MKGKHLTALGLAVILAAGSLSACGSSEGAGEGTQSVQENAERTGERGSG